MAYTRAYLLVSAAFVVLFALAAASTEQTAFRNVVLHLDQFQTPSGGFVLSHEAGAKPSLEATSHALFLSSLFGLKKKINSNAVPQYLQTLENGDSGYGRSAGLASDLESVRHAVLSYQRLGLTVPNSANVAAFIKSLVDPETKLIASRAGESGNLKATALAFQTLEILGELQRQWVQENLDHIKTYLNKHFKPTGNFHFTFPEEKDLQFLSANYYGIVLSSFVGFDLGSLPKWAQFIASMQSKADGGFYSLLDKSSTSLESTANAISSLRLLQSISKEKASFLDAIDTEKLANYVKNIPEDLRSAANAHLAIALTKKFVDNFEVSTNYEVLRASGVVDKNVVQGTQLRPILSVKTFGGVAHAGLDVEAQITSQGKTSTSKLHWKETEQYASEESFDTSNHLGDLTFNYIIRCFVAGVGELSFEKTDKKQVGYGLIVDADARLEVSGKEFAEGDSVPIGTDFSFSVTLQNQTHHNLVSGDFHVTFTVVDSSNVAVYSQSVDSRTSNGPVNFKYTLKSNNLPGGNIGFRFDVSNANGVHTTRTVNYQLSLPMIATAITFNGFSRNQAPTYKIGDNVQVSIEPATFPDLHTPYTYSSADVAGKPAADKRKFFMDVSSPGGVVLRSVAGKAAASAATTKYTFEVPVTPTLDAIGTNVVSFRYVPVSGEDIRLSNYDSSFGELYEDANSLNYTVRTELYMVDVKDQPSGNDYYYGNEISYRFKVLDLVSGKRVEKGSNDNANVYLSLQHADEDKTSRSFASTNEPANEVVEGGQKSYNIRWAINPNAVQGQGYLALSAQDADGTRFPLYVEGIKGKTVRYDVNIGGNITVAANTYSTNDIAYENTAFVAQFTLSCQDKSLRNAQLRCSVVRRDNGEAIASLLPAATNEAGEYAVSFTVPHNSAPSGDYVFRCFREVDRKRAVEAKEMAEKKRRIAEELKQFGDQASSFSASIPEVPADVESTLEPLFTIPIRHSAPYTGRLPVRTEYLALFLFGAAFFYASYQKKKYVEKR